MPHYEEAGWSAQLPEGWHGARDDESTVFRHEGGAGTLAVTLLCDKQRVTRQLLMELAASTREEGHSPTDVEVGVMQGLYFSYLEEETAWREWYLAAGNCLFFVTYDVPQGDESADAAEVEAIIASLTIK